MKPVSNLNMLVSIVLILATAAGALAILRGIKQKEELRNWPRPEWKDLDRPKFKPGGVVV